MRRAFCRLFGHRWEALYTSLSVWATGARATYRCSTCRTRKRRYAPRGSALKPPNRWAHLR